MIPAYYEFNNPFKVISGKNALENIPFELKNLNAKRPLILSSDRQLKDSYVKKVLDSFGNAGITIGAIFVDIPSDSSIEVVNKIAKVYKSSNCDSIIAIGGGKVIDTAKGVDILITENSEDLSQLMGVDILTKRGVPFIVIPTTAGTGSEATSVAVIADTKKNVKMEFISSHILPDIAILDERMFTSLPQRLTASTGMDALTHAIEAYTCSQKNPLSDAYAFAAIKLISEYLPEAVENGKDETVRLAMANASLMAGTAFSNSMVGLVHAIGHACGGVCHTPHGEAMSILLPFCMEYNLEILGEYYGELLLPLSGSEIYAKTPKELRGKKSIDFIREMSNQFKKICGLPTHLCEAGVDKKYFEQIAKTAVNDGAIIMNPKEASVEDVISILEKAY